MLFGSFLTLSPNGWLSYWGGRAHITSGFKLCRNSPLSCVSPREECFYISIIYRPLSALPSTLYGGKPQFRYIRRRACMSMYQSQRHGSYLLRNALITIIKL